MRVLNDKDYMNSLLGTLKEMVKNYSVVLTTKTKAKIIGVELQKEIFELAKESIELNKLENQIELINENIDPILIFQILFSSKSNFFNNILPIFFIIIAYSY